jgi:AcrR family transcriptional regulator
MADVDASLGAGGSEGAPEERLRRTVVAAMTLIREHLDYWRVAYQLRWQPSVSASLQQEVHAWTARILAALTARLADVDAGGARAADAEARARLLFATIDGVAQHYALDPDGYPIDAVIEALVASAPRRPAPGSGAPLPPSDRGHR